MSAGAEQGVGDRPESRHERDAVNCQFRSCKHGEGERTALLVVVDAAPRTMAVYICTHHRRLLTSSPELAASLTLTMEDVDA